MNEHSNYEHSNSYTSFDGPRRIATGPLQANALAARKALEQGADGPVLIFDDATGRTVDVDTRSSESTVVARLSNAASASATCRGREGAAKPAASRAHGRSKPEIVSREVALLARHWDWLARQPGGASVALRRLVEEARKANAAKDRLRRAHERAYHFMLAMAGDLPGFEEAMRALFANDTPGLRELIAAWPRDVREHAMRLARDEAPATRAVPAASRTPYPC